MKRYHIDRQCYHEMYCPNRSREKEMEIFDDVMSSAEKPHPVLSSKRVIMTYYKITYSEHSVRLLLLTDSSSSFK